MVMGVCGLQRQEVDLGDEDAPRRGGYNLRMNRTARSKKSRQDHDGDETAATRRRRSPVEVLHDDHDLLILNTAGGPPPDGDIPDDPVGAAARLAALGRVPSADLPLYPVFPIADASGLLIVGRRPDVAERLQSGLADGSVDLRFLAIVRGPISATSGTIDRPIAECDRGGLAQIDDRHGRPARTEWQLREAFVGFALVECRPRSAIRGQIRAHLQAAGLPLAVDRAYGGASALMLSSFKAGYHPSRRRPERPLIRRLSLHVVSATFSQPTTGEDLRFEAPPPKDFRATLQQLTKYGRLPPR